MHGPQFLLTIEVSCSGSLQDSAVFTLLIALHHHQQFFSSCLSTFHYVTSKKAACTLRTCRKPLNVFLIPHFFLTTYLSRCRWWITAVTCLVFATRLNHRQVLKVTKSRPVNVMLHKVVCNVFSLPVMLEIDLFSLLLGSFLGGLLRLK